MPKQKSHGGISKKIRVTNSGRAKISRVGANHNSGKKGTDFNRNHRKSTTLANGDAKRYKGRLG